MSLRVRWVPFVDDKRVASVRLRSLRPVDYLVRAGVDAALLRPGDLDCDVIVFQKAYDANHLRLAEEAKARGVRIVLDMCDNHLFVPDQGSPELRDRAGRVRRMMALADLVTVASARLAELLGSPDAVVVDDALELPDSVDRLALQVGRARRGRRGTVLWFGTAGAPGLPFGMQDLGRVLRADGAVLPNRTRLVVCSNSRSTFDTEIAAVAPASSYRTWRRRTFPYYAGAASVALLPISDNPYTAGKTSNRVATALLHGLPVVTDRLPSYEPYAQFVAFGHHAEAVAAYVDDRVLAQRHVREGAALAREQYDPARIAGLWRAAIETAAA